MELRQLRYFVAVAEDLHFNRAALRLHIAQPALSQQIRRLERELTVTLLSRTTRRVQLTEAGKVFLSEAQRVLAAADHARAAVAYAASGQAGLMRIGFVPSAALRIMATLVSTMQQAWPQVRLDLQETTTDLQVAKILEGTLDLGVVREFATTSGIVAERISTEPLILAVPTSHRLATRESVRLEELDGERFVVFSRDQVSRLHDHIYALCHHAGAHFEVVQEALQFPTILGLVAARIGVAIVPDALRALHLPGLRYLPFSDKEAYSTVSLICATERRHTPLVANCFQTAVKVSYSLHDADAHLELRTLPV